MAQLAQGLGFDLANALAGDGEEPAYKMVFETLR